MSTIPKALVFNPNDVNDNDVRAFEYLLLTKRPTYYNNLTILSSIFGYHTLDKIVDTICLPS